MNVLTGRFQRRFLPLSISGALQDMAAALRGKLSHADLAEYNAAQKLLYLGSLPSSWSRSRPDLPSGNRCSFRCCAC